MSTGRLRKIVLGTFTTLLLLYGLSWIPTYENPSAVWGVTWSQYYAMEELGLDWRPAYLALLDELRPPKLRLIAYWQYHEPDEGTFRFDDLDWQIEEAAKRDIPVTLSIGHRVPRWPECHSPEWAKRKTEEEFGAALKRYLSAVVTRYREVPVLERWQVENEPYIRVFGICPPLNVDFLHEEFELVRALDPSRPVLLTDSGELSTWRKNIGYPDVVGTTLYRTAWNPYTGWWTSVFPPFWYTARAWMLEMTGADEVIVAELQAEPWAPGGRSIVAVPFDEQIERYDVEEFKRMEIFARATGLPEIYLWGAEWWYWRKERGDDLFWNEAKALFATSGGVDTRGMMEP